MAGKKNSAIYILDKKPEEFLECRDIGHSWTKLGNFWWGGKLGVCRVHFCTRCMTERETYMTRKTKRAQWEIFDRRYRYPDDYLVKSDGETKISKSDVRNLVLQREELRGDILTDREQLPSVPQLADL